MDVFSMVAHADILMYIGFYIKQGVMMINWPPKIFSRKSAGQKTTTYVLLPIVYKKDKGFVILFQAEADFVRPTNTTKQLWH